MKRTILLLQMAVLALAAAAVVVLASPYAPVIEPAGDIEALWAIEDARTESETPLVTALECNGLPVAYDVVQNTFFCPLGMENGDTWPEIRLTAPGAQDISLVFSDDYTYDWCSDAIRDGYAYEAMAYTDTEFSYFYIVFTGLPQVMITTTQEITAEDSPAHVVVSAFGEAPFESSARIHLRGASTMHALKKNYKLEFTRERNGKQKKTDMDVPGFGMTDEVALLPGGHDDIKMRDKLNWELYGELVSQDEPFGMRRAEYYEVFIDGLYAGLYLMIEPMDAQEELELAGQNHLRTDSVYRSAALNFSRDREYFKNPRRANAGYELYYAPQGQDPFANLQAYVDLVKEEDDEAFARKAEKLFDLDNLVPYMLLMQGGGICDNFFNNMYIWAQPTQDGMKYFFAPWDLDMCWGLETESIGEYYENWLHFPVADRMINLNVGGIRQKVYDTWQEMRRTIFSREKLEERIAEYAHIVGDSGAQLRDTELFAEGDPYPDGYELIIFADMHWPLIDQAMEMLIASDEPLAFLTNSNYVDKGGSMLPTLGLE